LYNRSIGTVMTIPIYVGTAALTNRLVSGVYIYIYISVLKTIVWCFHLFINNLQTVITKCFMDIKLTKLLSCFVIFSFLLTFCSAQIKLTPSLLWHANNYAATSVCKYLFPWLFSLLTSEEKIIINEKSRKNHNISSIS